MHAAIIASTIANANRGKRGRAYKPEDFLPNWDRRTAEPAGEQTGEDHLRMIRALNKAMGGQEQRRGAEGVDAGGSDGEGGRRRQRRQ